MAEGRLLIVEDERIVARDLQVTLQQLGYEVVQTVADARDAINCAEVQRPDLVLMDIVLRGEMDGIQAAEVIRQHLEIPVVYLTAHADQATLERAKITEPFGYVLKPFDERELHTAVMMALHKNKIDRELRQNRQWLATTFRSIGDAAIATDDQGQVLLMNPVAESLTGWPEAEAKGHPLANVFTIINEHTRVPVENPVERVLREGAVVGLANHTLLVSRDGVEWPIDDSAAPIRDTDGTMLGVVLVFRDVSDRRRLEFALHDRARQLEDSHRRKDEFLAMLSHELRNPLAPIRLGLELLNETGRDNDVVSVMRAQVEHMVRLVDDLLDASRITRGKIELRKQAVKLSAVISAAVEMAQPVINERHQQLEVSLPEEELLLDADPVRLTQAFGNLLNNAAKYSSTGGSIRMHSELSNDTVTIGVQDQGIGIHPEWLPRIFDLFTQADGSLERSQSGLGIGLTLAQNLVQMHGGEMTAHSDGLGHGSEFRVTLPILRKASASPQPGSSSDRSPDAPRARRVMIVDDNRDSALLTGMLLEQDLGMEIAMAYDAQSALELAGTFRPDTVLLDIGLPGTNGYAVARQLRQMPGFEDVLLIALTGYGQEQDRRKSLEAGFGHHLTKPASLDSLRAVLDA